MASLEGLRKKFPENYVVWEIPGVPLKINGEDWVLERHPDSYYLTRGTPESIRGLGALTGVVHVLHTRIVTCICA